MLSRMRVIGLSFAALFFFCVAARAQAPLPPTKAEIMAVLNAPDVEKKFDQCAGQYLNPDKVKLTIIVEKNGAMHLTDAEPELEPDLYTCIYDVIAALSFGQHEARLRIVATVRLPAGPIPEDVEDTWRTAGQVSIAGLSLMGIGAAMLAAGIMVAWADPERYSDKAFFGYTLAGVSMITILPGAVLSLTGLMTRAGLLRSRGLEISPLGTIGGWIFLATGVPITMAATVMMFVMRTAMAGDCLEEGCGDDSSGMVGFIAMLTVGGALLVGSLASQAAQYRYLDKKMKGGLAALPAVVPFVTMSAGPRGSVPVAGLAGVF